MYFVLTIFVFFFIFETVSSCLSTVVQSSMCARFELGEAVNQAVEAVNQLEAVNQRMASCVAQLTASYDAQPVLMLFNN